MFKGNDDFRDSLNHSPRQLNNSLQNVDTFLAAVPQVTLGLSSGVWLTSGEKFWNCFKFLCTTSEMTKKETLKEAL